MSFILTVIFIIITVIIVIIVIVSIIDVISYHITSIPSQSSALLVVICTCY